MSIAQALFVPGAMAFLVALLMLGSWLEVRLVKAERELKLVPAEAGGRSRPSTKPARPAA
jgi:hypothetical protein